MISSKRIFRKILQKKTEERNYLVGRLKDKLENYVVKQ